MPRLTYRELGDRLGITPDGARFLARRRGWQTAKGNDGRVRVLIDDADLIPRSTPIARPIAPPIDPDHDRVVLIERAARAEGEASALRDALADLAGRLDKATAELTEARRPWLERLIAAFRP